MIFITPFVFWRAIQNIGTIILVRTRWNIFQQLYDRQQKIQELASQLASPAVEMKSQEQEGIGAHKMWGYTAAQDLLLDAPQRGEVRYTDPTVLYCTVLYWDLVTVKWLLPIGLMVTLIIVSSSLAALSDTWRMLPFEEDVAVFGVQRKVCLSQVM